MTTRDRTYTHARSRGFLSLLQTSLPLVQTLFQYVGWKSVTFFSDLFYDIKEPLLGGVVLLAKYIHTVQKQVSIISIVRFVFLQTPVSLT